MNHSEKFEQIKEWYNLKMWDEKKVKDAVDKSYITIEEYNEIVND